VISSTTPIVVAVVLVLVVLAVVTALVLRRSARPSRDVLPPPSEQGFVCPFCKRPYDPPQTGGRCPSCGAAAPRS
jgi:hypothetical protein